MAWFSKIKTSRLFLGKSGDTAQEVTATAAELNIMDGVTATAAELNRINDVSGRIVSQAAGDFTFTVATHGDKITVVNDADCEMTLPAATGSGIKYTIVTGDTDFTSGLVSVTGDDTMIGIFHGTDTDAEAAYQWVAQASDNEINLSGAATGGKTGDTIAFTDILADIWLVEGFIQQSGGSEATPFDAAS